MTSTIWATVSEGVAHLKSRACPVQYGKDHRNRAPGPVPDKHQRRLIIEVPDEAGFRSALEEG
jgi:hypothetical protein